MVLIIVLLVVCVCRHLPQCVKRSLVWAQLDLKTEDIQLSAGFCSLKGYKKFLHSS